MSPIRLPSRAAAIPAASASWQTSSRRCDSGVERADPERVRAVRDRAVERDADVDRHEVAVLDDAPVRDPVDDHLVHRDADRAGIPAIAERRRHAAVLADEVVRDAVELERGDPGLDALTHVRDRPRDQRARGRDPDDLCGALADDHAIASSSSSSSASAISAVTCSIVRSAWIEHELARRAIALDDRLGLLVVELEPPGDRVRRVVLAPLLPRPAAQPLDGDVVRDVEEEDRVEAPADPGQHRVERFGLREVAREPVEHETAFGVRLGEALADQLDGQVVGHELTGREDRLDPAAELRAGRDRRRGTSRRSRCAGSRTPPRAAKPACPSRIPAARARAGSRPAPRGSKGRDATRPADRRFARHQRRNPS